MEQKFIEHHAAVTVDAPVHQVYSMFSHFNDFPKFMSFVKEVTYFDDQRSHWVVDVAGRHEWDAVNEGWIPDRQIGWHSFGGLSNTGRVVFEPTSARQTRVEVYIDYDPPASFLGLIGEYLGVGNRFEKILQQDLYHFAEMIHQSSPGALDPASSNYLFHEDSAAARGKTTERQNATMGGAFSSPAFTSPETMQGTDEVPPPPPDEGMVAGAMGGTRPSDRMGQGMPEHYGQPDQPVLDRDIINEPENRPPASSQSARDADEGRIRPEQIPPWDRPESEQQLP